MTALHSIMLLVSLVVAVHAHLRSGDESIPLPEKLLVTPLLNQSSTGENSTGTVQPVQALPTVRGRGAVSKVRALVERGVAEVFHTHVEERADRLAFLAGEFRIPPKLFLISRYKTVDDLPRNTKANVQQLLELNPNLNLTWLDDDGCKRLITEPHESGLDVSANSGVLLFESLHEGKYRSDLCRTVALFRHGGFYVDLDVEMKVPMHHLVDRHTSFVSAWTSESTNEDPLVLNAILGAEPQSPVVGQTLRTMRLLSPGGFREWKQEQREGKTMSQEEFLKRNKRHHEYIRGIKNPFPFRRHSFNLSFASQREEIGNSSWIAIAQNHSASSTGIPDQVAIAGGTKRRLKAHEIAMAREFTRLEENTMHRMHLEDAETRTPAGATEYGPETYAHGLKAAMIACEGEIPELERFDTEVCGMTVRMYHEVDMTAGDPYVSEEVIQLAMKEGNRSKSSFDGLRFGIFRPEECSPEGVPGCRVLHQLGEPGSTPAGPRELVQSELIGYSRFAACGDYGCDS